MAEDDVKQDLQAYLEGIQKYELLTAEQEQSIAREIRTGSIEARDKMVLSNLRLVIAIAYTYRTKGLPLADLIEEGNLGLLKAVNMFNPDLKFRFSTYASWWIKLYIKRAITNNAQTVKIPAYMIEEIYKWMKHRSILADQLGRAANTDEIAKVVGVNKKKGDAIVKAMKLMESYNMNENIDMISDIMANPETDQSLFDDYDQEIIKKIVDELDERDRFIIIRRFGLDGGKPQTLDEIGKDLSLTRERVRQLEAKIIQKLNILFKKESKL